MFFGSGDGDLSIIVCFCWVLVHHGAKSSVSFVLVVRSNIIDRSRSSRLSIIDILLVACVVGVVESSSRSISTPTYIASQTILLQVPLVVLSVSSFSRVERQSRIQLVALQHHLINMVSLRTRVYDLQLDSTQYRNHFHTAVQYFRVVCAGHDLRVTDEELVLGIRLTSDFSAYAFLRLLSQRVFHAAFAIVALPRISEEVVTFQHLGIATPYLLVDIVGEAVRSMNIIYQFVLLQPSQAFRLRIFGNHVIHQQGTDFIRSLPLITNLLSFVRQTSISSTTFGEVEFHIASDRSAVINRILLSGDRLKIVVHTSGKQSCHSSRVK